MARVSAHAQGSVQDDITVFVYDLLLKYVHVISKVRESACDHGDTVP